MPNRTKQRIPGSKSTQDGAYILRPFTCGVRLAPLFCFLATGLFLAPAGVAHAACTTGNFPITCSNAIDDVAVDVETNSAGSDLTVTVDGVVSGPAPFILPGTETSHRVIADTTATPMHSLMVTGSGVSGNDAADVTVDSSGVDVPVGIAGDGAEAAGFDVLYSTGTQAYLGSGVQILERSKGGNGGNASNKLVVFGIGLNYTAGNGGNGAAGGAASLILDSNAASGVIYGIAVESIGGTGGKGGNVDMLAGGGKVIGGNGGQGGNGSAVTLIGPAQFLTVETTGNGIAGLRAESVAGTGGDGGNATSHLITIGAAQGGDGGVGGDGGRVFVDMRANVSTTGVNGHGVFARSYGGAGGNGGTANGLISGKAGVGAGAGTGGTVTVTFEGTVDTTGHGATGIMAQSVAGFTGDSGSATSVLFTFGADQASGGDGGIVEVTAVEGTAISTGGDDATGIFAQSVGGGGGKASTLSFGILSLGGAGSSGGNGAAVSVFSHGASIQTTGDDASAIFAQSIGGGGGNAGSGFGIATFGGEGGSGGFGATVLVENAASMSTTGDFSHGIHAQSIGGGGGTGGSAYAIGPFISLAFGGQGGLGGYGGDVIYRDAPDAGPITIGTAGESASGIVAESIGGGGGDGGAAISLSGGYNVSVAVGKGGGGGPGDHGGVVTVTTIADVSTLGANSEAIIATSKGGGGGNAGFTLTSANTNGGSFSLGLGGTGGTGGDGGKVTVTSGGALTTANDSSSAIVAGSLGGGGGNASTVVAGTVISQYSISLAIGQSGGGGGNGNNVEVTASGPLQTGSIDGDDDILGAFSRGIDASSIGGGGGNGSLTIAAEVVTQAGFSLAVGGGGGNAGSSGVVTVTNTGGISTLGAQAEAILALSQAGNGGNGGTAIATGSLTSQAAIQLSVGGGGGAGGIAGDVVVDQYGEIETFGAESDGISAQSLGGAGGNAGYTVAASIINKGSLNLAIGRSSGDGGTSGDVTVDNQGAITTHGDAAEAIFAQSLGGNGGSGTMVLAADAFTSLSVNMAFGSSGGSGGTAGKVGVSNTGDIAVSGNDSVAIMAQNIGGDGGKGALAIAGGITANTAGKDKTGAVSLSLGGTGGSGGTANDGTDDFDVTVTNSGAIYSDGYLAYGIFAQSLGGSGGRGGAAYSGSVTMATKQSFAATVAIGGSGGDGGLGGDVMVENLGDVETTQFQTHAIFAQSVGGDGGSGGGAYAIYGKASAQGLQDTEFSMNYSGSFGGSGGSGMDAGIVDVFNAGDIITDMGGSYGILAQSVGGGGGDGGIAGSMLIDLYPAVSGSGGSGNQKVSSLEVNTQVGGKGGASGDGDTVTVHNDGSITTEGDEAYGIFAQSVGGGGGNGGSAGNKTIKIGAICDSVLGRLTCAPSQGQLDGRNKIQLDPSLAVNIGGSGGAAGSGGDVNVLNEADVATNGASSAAIYAMSIGGGGGNGGKARSDFDFWTDGDTFSLLTGILDSIQDPVHDLKDFEKIEVSIGGRGGANGHGGNVGVINNGQLTTTGDDSNAIHAISIGGGGGDFAQGGDALTKANLAVIGRWSIGGTGSGGGNGGDVSVENTADITTTGKNSVGIFAETIGGGGGSAGDVQNVWSPAGQDINLGVGVGIQKDTGAGGNGGDIEIASGNIATTGENAHGIQAVTIGGSGGQAGVSEIGTINGEDGPLTDAEIAVLADYGVTEQDFENFDSGILTFVGSAGDEGSGGLIAIDVDGEIAVSGEGAIGVIATTVSGVYDSAVHMDLDGVEELVNDTGEVTIAVTGKIHASGAGGRAILAASAADETQGGIVITIDEGSAVQTELGALSTVTLIGSELADEHVAAEIANDGTLRAVEEVDDEPNFVLTLVDTYMTVTNNGLLGGSINGADSLLLGSTATAFNTITNASGGTILLGQQIVLGESSVITSDGFMTAADIGVIGESLIEVQDISTSGASQLQVDLNFGLFGFPPATADYIELAKFSTAGQSAVFAGEIVPYVVSAAGQTDNLLGSGTDPISGSYVIIQSDYNDTGDVFDGSGLTVSDRAAVAYAVSTVTNATGPAVVLEYELNLAPWTGFSLPYSQAEAAARATRNQRNFGAYFQQVAHITDGATADQIAFMNEAVTFAANIVTVEELLEVYQSWIPEEQTIPLDAALYASLDFADKLISCDSRGDRNTVALSEDGNCLWLSGSGGYLSRKDGPEQIGYEQIAYGVQIGGQAQVADGFFVGLGGSYEQTIISSDRLSEDSTGDRYQGGLVLKAQNERVMFSTALSGGYANMDLGGRDVITPNGVLTTDGTTSGLYFGAAHARLAVDLGDGNWSIVPTLDAAIDVQHQPGYEETGAGDYGMRIDDYTHYLGVFNPFLEIGRSFSVGSVQGQIFSRAGALSIVNGEDRALSASFVGVPENSGLSYDVVNSVEPFWADVGLGFGLSSAGGWSMTLEGRALMTPDMDQQNYSGNLKIQQLF